MSVLFIIGNGFDLAHNMPTKYSDFSKFIMDKFPQSKVNCDTALDDNLDSFKNFLLTQNFIKK